MENPSARLRTTSVQLRWIRSLREFGTRYTIRKNLRQQERAAKRLHLLQEEVRHQLLLSKELEQQQQQLQHRLQELSPVPPLQTQALPGTLEAGVRALNQLVLDKPEMFPGIPAQEARRRLQLRPDAPTNPSSPS